MLEKAFFQNRIRPHVRTTSLEEAFHWCQASDSGGWEVCSDSNYRPGSDIIQLYGLSMGLDVDRRTGLLLLHSSPFKPEGVTVSMCDTGGQKKVLDCSNVISDELGFRNCIFGQSEGTVCVYPLFSLQKLLWLSRLPVSKQSLCLHIHCLYFRFEGDVKYDPCTIHSSVHMFSFVVAMVFLPVFFLSHSESVLTNCFTNQVEHRWGQEDICTTICTGIT